jgi:hypothetical protein
MNPRIRQLAQEARDALRLHKFTLYCKAAGLGSVEAEHDRLYTESQQNFFEQYEKQMHPLLYALENIVDTED